MRVRDRGFTMIELLVVMSIIALLISMLVPVVQGARERARIFECANNLYQLSRGCMNHETTHGIFPTNGWGFGWIGDPDRGFDKKQVGGWVFNVLPFVDQRVLYESGRADMSISDGKERDTKKRAALTKMISTPVKILNCPTRRSPMAYPYVKDYTPVNCSKPEMAARCDYAINGGSKSGSEEFGPSSLAAGDARKTTDWKYTNHNGISYQRSEVRSADVFDGLQCTYMLTERSVNPDCYTSGMGSSDDQSCYIGHDRDICCFTYMVLNSNGTLKTKGYNPTVDVPGIDTAYHYGSAHTSGYNVVFCDGSSKHIAYNIDLVLHYYLGSRNGKFDSPQEPPVNMGRIP